MAVTIEVNSVDRTQRIEYDSVRVSRALTNQVDTFDFDVFRDDLVDWVPEELDDVIVYDGSQVIFGGQIIDIERDMMGGTVEVFHVSCKDFSFELDRLTVAEVYENMTVGEIVQDIVDNFTTGGYTYANVNAPANVTYKAFRYEYPSKCIKQLCEEFGYDWYVDSDKDIHVFQKFTEVEPFDLTDTNGKYYFDSLKIKTDVKNLKNTIYVRGGQYQGSTITEGQVADGDQKTFLFAYKYANATFEKNGTPITVGIDFVDPAASYDALYNFNEKALKFPDGTKPANGDLIEITGNPYIPVIVKVKDPISIAEFGQWEYKIVDKSINSKQGARDRAAAELRGWADKIYEASFQTKEAGLEVGQKINVQSDIRDLDQDYIITRIKSNLINGTEFRHDVTLVTTQTYGMIEFLQSLLQQKDKEIQIDENEVLDLVESIYETITIDEAVVASIAHNTQTEAIAIAESTTVQALDYAVEFCVGYVGAPSGVKRQFILNGSPLA